MESSDTAKLPNIMCNVGVYCKWKAIQSNIRPCKNEPFLFLSPPTPWLCTNIITNKENNRLIKANISKQCWSITIIRCLRLSLRMIMIGARFVRSECACEIWFSSRIDQHFHRAPIYRATLYPTNWFYHACACIVVIVARMFHNNYTTFESVFKETSENSRASNILRMHNTGCKTTWPEWNFVCANFDQDIDFWLDRKARLFFIL